MIISFLIVEVENTVHETRKRMFSNSLQILRFYIGKQEILTGKIYANIKTNARYFWYVLLRLQFRNHRLFFFLPQFI